MSESEKTRSPAPEPDVLSKTIDVDAQVGQIRTRAANRASVVRNLAAILLSLIIGTAVVYTWLNTHGWTAWVIPLVILVPTMLLLVIAVRFRQQLRLPGSSISQSVRDDFDARQLLRIAIEQGDIDADEIKPRRVVPPPQSPVTAAPPKVTPAQAEKPAAPPDGATVLAKPDALAPTVIGVQNPETALEPVAPVPRTHVWPDLADYEILAEIGHGGMGSVYKARHRQLGRVVALKTIRSSTGRSRGEVARFQAEVQSAARLDHPRVVPVFEAGETGGMHYFTMALIEGESLAERLKRGPLEAAQAAYIVAQAAEAVAFAHQHGVIHRDIKPGNILLDRQGAASVADFGLARQLDVDDVVTDLPLGTQFDETLHTVARLTMTGAILGTPAYMSPEQALDTKRAKEPADIWALGAVLFACLTGRPPFIGGSVMETITLVIEGDPPPLRHLAPHVHGDLEAICVKCLTKDPAFRYQSATELVLDLERWRTGRTPRAARISRLEQLRRLDKEYPEALPILAALVVPWIGSLQEAVFVGAALAGMRFPARWPGTWSLMIPIATGLLGLPAAVSLFTTAALPQTTAVPGLSGYVWSVATSITGIIGAVLAIWAFNTALSRYRSKFLWIVIGLAAVGVFWNQEWGVSTAVGGTLGAIVAIGASAARIAGYRTLFWATTCLAAGSALGLRCIFPTVGTSLRSITGISVWNGQFTTINVASLGETSLWLLGLAFGAMVAVALAGSVLISQSRQRQQRSIREARIIDLSQRILLGLFLTALLGMGILCVWSFTKYFWLRTLYLSLGPAAGALSSLILGFSLGTLSAAALQASGRLSRRDPPSAEFVGRLSAVLSAFLTLIIIAFVMPVGAKPELDVTGYFGPGPLLTTVEWVVSNRLGMAITHAWSLVFLARYVVLWCPMLVVSVVAAMLCRRRLLT